jgi:acyl dehydratase
MAGSGRAFESIKVGDRHTTGSVTVTAAEVETYCRRYDPQPQHLDETAADASLLGGLSTSGWHTASLTMHLLATSGLMGGDPIIGVRAQEMRWPRPVRPGDELHAECEVVEARRSNSGKQLGYVTWKIDTKNQRGETVMEMITTLVVPTEDSASEGEG